MIRRSSCLPQQGIAPLSWRILSFALLGIIAPFGVLSGQEKRPSADYQRTAAQQATAQRTTAPRTASPAALQNAPRQAASPRTSPRVSSLQKSNPNYPARNPRMNPRSSRPQAAQTVKERPSENPVRFVFAPKKTPQADWNPNPSAASIMSTFVTGEMAPEVLQWHVNQRKRVNYEKWLAWKEANSETPLTRQEANFLHAARQSRSPSSDSEYSRMIARTEFSLGAHRGGSDAELTPPASNSILLQLFTGYKNQEMKGWKENKIEYLAQNRNRLNQNNGTPFGNGPYFPEGYPDQFAASGLETQMASVPRIPRSMENSPYAAPYAAPFRTNPAESISPAVRTETTLAQSDRFVDDQFPQVKNAGYRRQNVSSPIRQVSAEMTTTDAPRASRETRRVLGTQEKVQKPGELKAYPIKKQLPANALRPLPSCGENAEEEGWNPVP